MSTGTLPPGEPDALRATIAAHPFCAGIDAAHVVAMAEGAVETRCGPGDLVLRRGGQARVFHLLVEGTVALEVAAPAREPLTIETLHAGEPLGWSWLYPDHTWDFDARCLTDVRSVALDAACLHSLMDDDPVFGRDLALRVGRIVVDRLQHTRQQLVDVQHHDHH
jgi:CRP/FNR family transcriptional regulator, cyclic AMP receptor protein